MILLLGDIHAEYRLLFDRLKNLNPQPTAILQVGDMGGEDKTYPDFPIPTYFIQGNHENWDTLYGTGDYPLMQKDTPKNLYHIANGEMITVEGLFVAGLGGNYSSKFLSMSRSDLPQGRRRHFTQHEVDDCMVDSLKAWYDLNRVLIDLTEVPSIEFSGVDILLTHEAPSPYMNRNRNCGIGKINEVIKNAEPKLHFFGHHHYDGEYEYEGVKSYGLGMGFLTGMLLDPETLKVERINLI